MIKLKLILSPIDGVKFKIFADGYGEAISQLPFSDGQGDAHLFTVLNCLDVIGTNYKNRKNDDQNWMKQAGLLSQEDSQFFHPKMTENIGHKLYESLFIDKIEQALFQELGKTQGKRLHIQIQYDANVIESSLLPLYPWQLVHNQQDFLADYQVTFSYLIAHTNPPPQGTRKVKQIKILFIPSTASDEQYQSIESKESAIALGLKKASQKGHACLLSWYQEAEKPTIGRLRAYLTEQNDPPDIIHFDGHGFFKRKCTNPECPKRDTNQVFYSLNTQQCQWCSSVLEDPQGFLFFDRDSPGIDYISGADFARLVGQSKPMLVVITACKSALAYKSDSVFNGIAQKLLHQVPAVVATPFSLSEESATNFVEQLYRALGAKKSLLEAVKLATDAMRNHKYEWYRPVIFLRSDSDEDGNLFEWEVTSDQSSIKVTPIQKTTRHDEYNKSLIEEFSTKPLFNEKQLTLKDIYVRLKCRISPDCMSSSKNDYSQNYLDTFDLLKSLIDINSRKNAGDDYSINYKVKLDRLLIFGFPGQGKTSFCKFIAHELLVNKEAFTNKVYLFQLRYIEKKEFDSFLDNPLDYIKNDLNKRVFEGQSKDISEELRGSLIILDGLDELDIKRTYLGGEYEKLLEKILLIEEDLIIVMTSRYIDICLKKLETNLLPLIVNLVEFNSEQQKEWLRKYKEIYPDIELTENIIDHINQFEIDETHLDRLEKDCNISSEKKKNFEKELKKIENRIDNQIQYEVAKIREEYKYGEIEKSHEKAKNDLAKITDFKSYIQEIKKYFPSHCNELTQKILEEANNKELDFNKIDNKKKELDLKLKESITSKRQEFEKSFEVDKKKQELAREEGFSRNIEKRIDGINSKLQENKKLLEALKPIQELISQPLLLYLIARLNIEIKPDIDINTRIAQITIYQKLIEKTIDNLFEQIVTSNRTEKVKVRILTGVTKEDYRTFIQDLAFTIFLTGTEVISFDEAKEHVNEFIQKLSAFDEKNPNLLKGILPTFYFKKIEDEEGLIEFAHKSFGEFMATEKIWSILSKLDEVKDLAEQNSSLMNILSKQIITEEMFAFLKEMIRSCLKELKDNIFNILKKIFLDEILQIDFLNKRIVQEISTYFFNIYSILGSFDYSEDFLLEERKKSVFVKELIILLSIYENIPISLTGQSISKDDLKINTNHCSFAPPPNAPNNKSVEELEKSPSFWDFYK